MSGIAERKRLRETRARPWLVNSVAARVKKLTRKTTPLDSPKRSVYARKAPSVKSAETRVFEEELRTTLDRLSLSASRSRIPTRVPGVPLKGCMKVVRVSSDDESRAVSDSSSCTALPEGGKQPRTPKIPIPS